MVFFFRDDLIFFIPNTKFLMNENDYNSLNKVKFNSLNKNIPIDLKFKDQNGILGMGWSHNLEGRSNASVGSWTEGYISSIFFNNFNNEDVKLIKLNITSSIALKNENLKIEFYLNNKKIKFLEVKNKFNHFINLDLKNNLINGTNHLKIVILNPVSPVSKLESVDGRLLGLKLKSIELK